MNPRAAGLLLGFAADRLLGDPHRFHPVAGFGAIAGALERQWYADSRIRGVAHTTALVGTAIVLGAAVEWGARHPLARLGSTAVATWLVLGGRSLEREARAVDSYLLAGDLPTARQRLTHLVGRDTSTLEESEIVRAVVESVAENTVDAVVAPLFWGAVAGLPGLLAYRTVNTLDAMVGHHNDRYEQFGWAAARLDDLINLPGSRLAGLAMLVASPRTAPAAARTWYHDAAAHPSPNAGVAEAVLAGALGIRLGGTNRYYGSRVEHRAVMGRGRAARREDIARATRLARRVGAVGVAVSACIARLLSANAS